MFKLRLGVATSSEGIPCARSAGVPTAVLQRAEAIKECVRLRHPIEWACGSSEGGNGRQRTSVPPLLRHEKHRKLLQHFLQTEDWTLADQGPGTEDGQDPPSINKLETLMSLM